jgi:chromate transporter
MRAMGMGFDAPVPASLDPWALALSAAALVAVFRFKAKMIPTLLACSAAGIALHFAGVV